MDNLFEEFFREGFYTTKVPLNAYQTDTSVVVELYAPNLDADKFKVSVNNGVLKIEGGLSRGSNESRQYYHREFTGKEFVRTVVLPINHVDIDGVSAEYRDGILAITFPKKSDCGVKNITVK